MRLFVLLLFLLPLTLHAQIEDAREIFRELRSMEGVWFMPTERGDRLEIWEAPNDSTMEGRDVRIRQETMDTVTLETISLELRNEDIYYRVTVRGQNDNQPVVFKLTTADYDGYLFENPEHNDPQKIRYVLLGNRELQVFTEGQRGGRTVTREYVFEREFSPGAVEFRARLGANVFNLRQTGNLLTTPDFAPRPGWELGTTLSFRGRGGFITLNADLGLAGKNIRAESFFVTLTQGSMGQDTIVTYQRDLTYRQVWLQFALYPELRFGRDSRLSVYAGPYLSRLLITRTRGTELPGGDNKLFEANNDFNRTDLGLIGGLQYRLNFGKKDIGGLLGVRANMGLANIDNLYTRGTNNPAFYNGQITLYGLSVYYSMDILKL